MMRYRARFLALLCFASVSCAVPAFAADKAEKAEKDAQTHLSHPPLFEDIAQPDTQSAKKKPSARKKDMDKAVTDVPASSVATAPAAEMPQSGAGGMALRDVLRQTYDTNPTLRAARAGLEAAREKLPQAQAGWKPVVGAEAAISHSDVTIEPDTGVDGSTEKNASVSVTQPVFRGGRTVADIRAAKNAIRAETFGVQRAEQEILLSAAQAYLDVLRDEAVMNLRENDRDVVARQLKASQDRFAVGEVTKTDVSQSTARLARAESELIAARGALRISRAGFQEIVGMAPEGLARPDDVSLPLPVTLDDALAMAEKNNPDIQVARYSYRSADDNKDSVFGELLPEINAFGTFGKTWDPSPGVYDSERSAVVGLKASIPLYEAGSVRSRLRQARHTADQRYMNVVGARRGAAQQIISSWEDLVAARAEIDSRKAQVEASRLARDGVHQEADVGERTIIDALDADQEYLDAQVSLVTAERNEMVAQFALAAALGLLGPENLGFPDRPERH